MIQQTRNSISLEIKKSRASEVFRDHRDKHCCTAGYPQIEELMSSQVFYLDVGANKPAGM